jgi:PAS domain S-box-containing protein
MKIKNKKYSLSLINSSFLLISLVLIMIAIFYWFYFLTQKTIETNIENYFDQTSNLSSIILEQEENNLKNIAFEVNYIFEDKMHTKDKLDNKIYTIISEGRIDLIFLRDGDKTVDYSNSLFDTKAIIKGLNRASTGLVSVQSNGIDYIVMLRSKKIIDSITGRVKSTIFIGKILNDNFRFVNNIKSKAHLKSMHIFFKDKLISSSSKVTNIDMNIFNEANTIINKDYILVKKQVFISNNQVLDFVFVSENKAINLLKESFFEKIYLLVLFTILIFTFLYLLSNMFIIKPFSNLLEYVYKIKDDIDIKYKDTKVLEFDNFANEIKGIIGELNDIKEEYSSAIDGVQDGLWSIDVLNHEIYCSPRYLSLIGYINDYKVRSIRFWKKHIHKDDYSRTIKKLKQHLSGKISLYEDEYRFKCKDGKYKWFKVRGKAFFDNNKLVRFTGFLTDINDIVLLQQDNNKKEQMLYQQSKLASMGEMISNIAHQWRQPLSIVSTISSSLIVQIEVGIFDKKDATRDLKKIMGSVEYLSTIINKFRNFFNPNNETETFAISEIIKDNIEIFETSYKSHNIKLILDLDDVEIVGYKFELMQVIINIMNNSKDALLENINSSNEKFIFIKTYNKDNKTYIKIYDNAGGINLKITNKIFEPYFTTKHKSQGTGLGLYMSNEIITRHFNGILSNKTINYVYKDNKYIGEEFTIEI